MVGFMRIGLNIPTSPFQRSYRASRATRGEEKGLIVRPSARDSTSYQVNCHLMIALLQLILSVLALLFKSRARLEAEIPTQSRRKKRPRCSEARFLPFNSGFGTAEVAAFLPSGKTIRERRDRSDTFRPNFAGGGSKEEARPWQSGRPRSCGGSNQPEGRHV